MFGTNAVEGTTYKDADESIATGKTLIVTAIWPTIQGEGPHAGRPAVFMRLQGCNLRCWFCDTDFSTGESKTVEEILERVEDLSYGKRRDLVVITGGEPMRQQIGPVCIALREHGFPVQIETAGTVWPPNFDRVLDYYGIDIVCSPKTPTIHQMVIDHCVHYKYIVGHGDRAPVDGLPWRSTQDRTRIAGTHAQTKPYRPTRPDATIWVQPRDDYEENKHHGSRQSDIFSNADNLREAVQVARLYGHRVSLQTHKILGVE